MRLSEVHTCDFNPECVSCRLRFMRCLHNRLFRCGDSASKFYRLRSAYESPAICRARCERHSLSDPGWFETSADEYSVSEVMDS